MNTLSDWIEYWNRFAARLSIWDLKLAQVWTAAWVLIIVKTFPQIMLLSIGWFVALAALAAPRLFYVLYQVHRPAAQP